jgi:hypothetical protein
MIEYIKIEELGESLKKDFKKIHDEHFVSVDEILKPQPVAISIGYAEYKGTNFPISIGSYGDFSCIVGASKAKKSFLKSMCIAGYIGGSSNLYFDNIRGHRLTDKFVIDIDTEQSEYHSQRVFKRVVELVGVNPDFYKPFSLRKLSANDRLEFINWLFTESPYVGNIGLVSIDGVADLVNDVNDLEASNKVAQKLLEWSANENCHIITVLHRNFGSAKPTGHLGSAVLKKAETVIFVEKDENITIVNPEYTRNQPFEPFAFEVGSDGLPRLVDNNKINKKINDKSKPKF